jgi:AraC-like DNA-binding protein
MDEMRDDQIKLIWTARIDYESNSGVSLHQHEDYHQLLIVLDGEGTVQIGTTHYPVEQNQFYFFRQAQPHAFSFSVQTTTLDFKFRTSSDDIDQFLSQIPGTGICPPSELEEFKKWYKMSLSHSQNPQPLEAFLIDSGFKGSLLTLIHYDSASHPATAQSLLETDFPIALYLLEHLHEEITLESLSEQFKFNSHYIINLFYEHVGVTPIQYLQMARLEKAKQLLELTTLSISDIAERVGWTHPYFSRVFSKKEGVSPSVYRNTSRTAISKDINLHTDFTNLWRITLPPTN